MRATLGTAIGVLVGCGGGGNPAVDGQRRIDAELDLTDAAQSACSKAKPGPNGVPAGTVLAPSGSIVVDTDGAIVEDLDITGETQVLANNVTIQTTPRAV